MHEIKAFQCDYCNKYYKHKSSAERHENRCYKNPANKACLTCGNFDNFRCSEYGEPYCKAKKRFMATNDFKYHCPYWNPIKINDDWDVADD